MEDKECSIIVGVFGDRSRAERAAIDLQADGYGGDELGVVWHEATGLCGLGGLGTAAAGSDVTPLLTGLGVGPEASTYYQREAAAGRCLLIVGGAPRPGLARAAIGRNCGSVRLPEEAKAA